MIRCVVMQADILPNPVERIYTHTDELTNGLSVSKELAIEISRARKSVRVLEMDFQLHSPATGSLNI